MVRDIVKSGANIGIKLYEFVKKEKEISIFVSLDHVGFQHQSIKWLRS